MTALITQGLVLLHREAAVAVLELNDPENHNALSPALAQALHDACLTLKAQQGVRVVLLCAAGHNFGVGGDLRAMAAGSSAEVARGLIEAMHGSVRLLADLPVPVLAAVQGAVVGGSLSLALMADLAIAASDTRLNLSYARIGASCDTGGSWVLPRLVGLRRAMAIAMLSDMLDAEEALRLGLVNRVVPADALRSEAMALARRLADGPTLAYGGLKRLLRQSLDNDLSTQLNAERDAFITGCATNDFREGVGAFLDKRQPRFRGH